MKAMPCGSDKVVRFHTVNVYPHKVNKSLPSRLSIYLTTGYIFCGAQTINCERTGIFCCCWKISPWQVKLQKCTFFSLFFPIITWQLNFKSPVHYSVPTLVEIHAGESDKNFCFLCFKYVIYLVVTV